MARMSSFMMENLFLAFCAMAIPPCLLWGQMACNISSIPTQSTIAWKQMDETEVVNFAKSSDRSSRSSPSFLLIKGDSRSWLYV